MFVQVFWLYWKRMSLKSSLYDLGKVFAKNSLRFNFKLLLKMGVDDV